MLNPMNSNNTQKAETNYLFGLLTKAIGNPRTNSLEHRLFNTFSLVNAVLNIAGSFSTFYLENFLVLFALNFGSGILFCGMYYLSRFRGIYFNLYWPLNLTILVFLGFNWITNGGSLGGAHYYLIPSIVVATILLRNQNIFFVYTIFLGVPASLFALEYFHPEYITQFANREQRFIDSSLNYIFV
ncbi:MAG: hypothetical protein K8R21_15785, partial [Leptospira sp.]|nr:hypothetical protein [Leptospira sp.]